MFYICIISDEFIGWTNFSVLGFFHVTFPLFFSDSGRKKLRFTTNEEREHISLLRAYIGDFLRYLQRSGFCRVKSVESAKTPSHSSSSKSKSFFGKSSHSNKRKTATVRSNSTVRSRSSSIIFEMEDGVEAVYVKKSILPNGGILFCELGICEPFVYMKLYALEASRFQNDLLKARTGAMTSNSTTRSGTLNRY